MNDALALLWPPLLVCITLVAIHAYFGIQVLARGVIFVDLALAQISALGATVAFMLGHAPQSVAAYGYSLGFTLIAAVLLALTRSWSARIPQEALIGVIYVVAAAAAILLIDRAPQGAEHLKQVLTGNILTTGADVLVVLVPLYAAIGGVHWVLRRRFSRGSSLAWDFVFYASFGLVVTSSVALAGVLLVFSILIVPAAIGVLHADTMGRQLLIGWTAGALTSAAGLAASFAFDLPTGAAMVCAFGVALAVAGIARFFLQTGAGAGASRGIATLRKGLALLLAASSVWWLAAPRADQPLLDIVESALPSVRQLYFADAEIATYEDARRYDERYRLEAERLNEREARNRAQGERIDDATLRQMSAFQKSYGEMRKGEQFVMNEVRARARERLRWSGGALLLLAAATVMPGSAALLRRAMVRMREA